MKNEIMGWIKMIVLAVGISLIINYLILFNATVPSGSMENNIMTGDRVMAFRHSYTFSKPNRKDIAIFHYPDDESIFYVKRIIGLPGETVDIIDGNIYINNERLYDEFIKEPMNPAEPQRFEVPQGHYFMLGDNRNRSLDSRGWDNKYVSEDKIIGRVLFRYFRTFTWY